MSDLSVPFDAFTIDPFRSPLNYARVHCRVEGRRVATFGYTTGVSSPRPPQAVYQTTSIVLHRRGRRLVRRGDAEQFEATDGAVSVFPAGTEICPRYLEPCEGLVVGLSPELVAEVSRRVGARAFPSFVAIRDDVLRGMCEAFWAVSGRGRQLPDALAVAAATHVLEQYADRTPALPGWLRRATVYIDSHLATPLQVGAVAAAAGMSRSHFTRLFKTATGESPRAFVVGQRVERAKELLEADPELPLAEVAAEVGFCDQSHLTSHFRKLAGRTPAAFRDEGRHKSPSA